MNKLFSLAAVGLAAAGLTLTTPAESQAQFGRGVKIKIGGFGVSFGSGHRHHHGHGHGFGHSYGYAPRYSTFGGSGYYSPGYTPSYHYRPRPTIVHPETYHWTPRRGLHTHGHLHVPHGNHYHTIPY